MVDATMCQGGDCPMKEQCYRYTAFPNLYRQSYFRGVPNKGDTCDEFWSNEGRRNTAPEDRK